MVNDRRLPNFAMSLREKVLFPKKNVFFFLKKTDFLKSKKNSIEVQNSIEPFAYLHCLLSVQMNEPRRDPKKFEFCRFKRSVILQELREKTVWYNNGQ